MAVETVELTAPGAAALTRATQSQFPCPAPSVDTYGRYPPMREVTEAVLKSLAQAFVTKTRARKRKFGTMLKIDNLHATVDDKAILNGLTLEVKAGEVHAIMGPNGAGKSTLAYVLGGRP